MMQTWWRWMSSFSGMLLLGGLLLVLDGWGESVAAPTLVQCVCNTTLASDAVVSAPTPASKGQAAKFVLPSCVDDVFAETGIRWYTNGPVRGDIAYWHKPPVDYNKGRAARRLISLGYRCTAVELFDPNEIIYYT